MMGTRLLTSTLVATTLLAVASTAQAAAKPELRIYVSTQVDASGLVDADQRRRQDSVADLRRVLDKGLEDFRPVVVDTPEQAQIRIDVLASGKEDLGDRTGWNPLTGMMGAGKVSHKRVIRGRVSIGTYRTEIHNKPLDSSVTWKVVAAHWQRTFRAWVNDNGPRLAELVTP
jgi:hypothetical protein